MKLTILLTLALSGFSIAAIAQDAGESSLQKIRLTLVDQAAHGYGTFQSNNQKVVAGKTGIFMTHIRTLNKPNTRRWRLSRSVNGGRSFETMYEQPHKVKPPVIELDSTGNVYLIEADLSDGNAYLYRFLVTDNTFADPVISTIPGGGGGKFAMAIDEERGRLYYLGHFGLFVVMRLNGDIVRSTQLTRPGPNASIQYPYLFVTPDDGTLHVAWTTQKHGEYMYRSIHHVLSTDAGKTWQHMNGTKLSPPLVCDETGPTLQLVEPDEFESHTWLSNMHIRNSKAHFFFLAQTKPMAERYLRYDFVTAKRDIQHSPKFAGQKISIRSLDGFFASSSTSHLYVVSRDEQGHLVCLISKDNGQSWRDYARSDKSFNAYSVGGSRSLAADGTIVGSFTDQKSGGDEDSTSHVYFFRIETRTKN